MTTPLHEKSSIGEIRARFDGDVERFSQLETGQTATMDAPLVLELLAQSAVAATPRARTLLDLGCGAGNLSLKLLQTYSTNPDVILCDLSRPMLDRAKERVSAATTGTVSILHGDLREADLEPESVDVIGAAAVLHHLRDDADWETVFAELFRVLRPGGSVWISDLVTHGHPEVAGVMWARYADYLRNLGGEAYQKEVFAYIDREDSPRPLAYQLDLLRRVGFTQIEVLHARAVFAAFGAIKS